MERGRPEPDLLSEQFGGSETSPVAQPERPLAEPVETASRESQQNSSGAEAATAIIKSEQPTIPIPTPVPAVISSEQMDSTPPDSHGLQSLEEILDRMISEQSSTEP